MSTPAADQAQASPPPTQKGRLRLPKISEIAVVMSLLGLAVLSFLAGAAAMHYRAPIARPLSDAFIGADRWRAGPMPPMEGMPDARVPVRLFKEQPDLASAGYTLWHTTEGAEAFLYDLKLGIAHKWKMPEGVDWPQPDGDPPVPPTTSLRWDRCHLYPNGDLLVLCALPGGPYGVGLAKLDKDSRLLWRRPGAYHHDFDVAEDGRIHALTRKQKDKLPPGFDGLAEPYHDDILTVLSPAGEILDEIPLVEAFKGTPYLATLLSCELTAPEGETAPGFIIPRMEMMRMLRKTPQMMPTPPPSPPGQMPPRAAEQDPTAVRAASMDVLHANGARVLSKAMAGKFPMFKAGHVLLSMRTPSLIAVLDPAKRSIVWAARGPWRNQHDAQFLDSGRILIYDNLGSSRGARVLEYDPATLAFPWMAPGPKGEVMIAPTQGRCQRLPNGNTVAVEPMKRVLEFTPSGEVAWEIGFSENVQLNRNILGAVRYRADELPFLKGAADARPK